MVYYLSNTDAEISLATLAHVASSRYTIEQCFEDAKDDVGLDHYHYCVRERQTRSAALFGASAAGGTPGSGAAMGSRRGRWRDER